MQPNDSDGRPTRRQTLQATLGGAATLTVGTGLVTAGDTDDGDGEGCDVSEEEKQRVREKWADPERLKQALAENEEIADALRENDLVEGEDIAVLVYAQVVDCEVVPEYRIYRKTEQETNLTISLMATNDTGYATQVPLDETDLCQPVAGSCPSYCVTDDCCATCYIGECGCWNEDGGCDPVCCWTCNCQCNDTDCSHHCEDDDPFDIDVEDEWMTSVLG